MQVEGQHKGSNTLVATGARVRNAYAIYLQQVNNPEKFGLIHRSVIFRHRYLTKDLSVEDEHAFD